MPGEQRLRLDRLPARTAGAVADFSPGVRIASFERARRHPQFPANGEGEIFELAAHVWGSTSLAVTRWLTPGCEYATTSRLSATRPELTLRARTLSPSWRHSPGQVLAYVTETAFMRQFSGAKRIPVSANPRVHLVWHASRSSFIDRSFLACDCASCYVAGCTKCCILQHLQSESP